MKGKDKIIAESKMKSQSPQGRLDPNKILLRDTEESQKKQPREWKQGKEIKWIRSKVVEIEENQRRKQVCVIGDREDKNRTIEQN